MENATKALLIAAAVLIAILLISLGIAVITQGREAIAGADMTEAEANQFNSKFLVYEGPNVSTSQVNALLSAVLSHNQQEAQQGTNRFVTVGGAVTQDTSASSTARVSGNDHYDVKCTQTKGIVTGITITKQTAE